MSNLQERLQQILQAKGGVNKQASAVDSNLIDNAEKTPVPAASVDNPADAQTGAAAECITDSVGAEGRVQPGTASEVGDGNIPSSPAGGIDVSVIEGNAEGEAAQVLGIEKDKVSKEESIEVINKAANAVKAIGARIYGISTEQLETELSKKASAPQSAQELLYKAANEGDVTAQRMIDWMTSYELGVAKKANDLAQLEEAQMSPEDVAAAEDQLNAQAIEDPAMLMEEEAAADPATMEALAAVGAEIEAAAQEATLEVAEAIMQEDPSITEEEAVTAAQEVVADALMTVDAQQALGATSPEGEYLVDDATAEQALDAMDKTASDNPMRAAVVDQLNKRFGLTPDAFIARVSR